jgi:hypothetical protein
MLMSDELDPQLLRLFAQHQEPLSQTQFLAELEARLPPLWERLPGQAAFALLHALQTGMLTTLRWRHAVAVLLAAAAAVGAALLA